VTVTAVQIPWAGEPDSNDFSAALAGVNPQEIMVQMAHDLRSPLASILFLAEAMQRGQSGPITDAQRKQLGLIRSAALGLCATASDVVELARGGERLTDGGPEAFSVSQVLYAIRDLVHPIVEEKRLELTLVPPGFDWRSGRPRALSRVLLNLTTNALKFTERGGVTVSAREPEGRRVEFSVSDTGPGIDADSLSTLYKPVRLSGPDLRCHFSHSGLGLAICQRLVQAMGSELFVDSTPGHGARFFFELDLPVVPRTR
jgi:signal transduction histidine kinase